MLSELFQCRIHTTQVVIIVFIKWPEHHIDAVLYDNQIIGAALRNFIKEFGVEFAKFEAADSSE